MNNTFRQVALFCGLRLSYYVTAALLAVSFVGLAITEYRTPSPLYILLSLAVLPSVIKALFFSEKKEKNALAFPLFCKKYRYDVIQYKTMNIAYLLLFILLAAWHISYIPVTGIPVLITRLPSLIAVSSLLIRILGIICYRLYFHLFPLQAMRRFFSFG